MYDSFYKVAENPFKICTDPRYLWCGEKHTQILTNLIYGIMDRNGLVVLTGDIGTGKTTLVNALLKIIGTDIHLAIINHPSLEAKEFLSLVAKSLDPNFTGTGKTDLLLFFDSFSRRVQAEGKTILLIIDEAQHLSAELLEEIRLLSNMEYAGQRILSIMLVGQLELQSMIESARNRSLRQRVTLLCQIQALSEKETPLYIEYRLKVSGLREQLFTARAMKTIHTFSQGNPRLINILCDRAMRIGFMKKHKKIDTDIIIECAGDLKIGNQMKVKVFELLGPDFFEWHRQLPTRLGKWFSTTKPKLQKSWLLIRERGKAVFPQIRSLTRVIADKLWVAYVRFKKEYRPKKTHPAIWMAGIGLIAISVIINLDKATLGKRDPNNRAVKQDAPVQWAAPANPTLLVSTFPSSSHRQGAMPTHHAPETDRRPAPEIAKPTLQPDTDQQTRLRLAASALEQKNYQKAVEIFESSQSKGVELNPETAGLYSDALLGLALETAEAAPSEAEALLLKAIGVSPDNARAYLALGKYRTRTKEYAQAVKSYRSALRLDPNLSDALFNLGFIYANTGRLEDAESAFSGAIELKPPYLGKSLFNLAVVQQKLGKKEQSLANLEKAVAMMPKNKKASDYLNRFKHSASSSSGSSTADGHR